jgi:hypothetical protein
MMAYHFAYSDLPADRFRLLHLIDLDDGDRLKCKLTNVPLDLTPEYDAISYT